MHRAAYFKIDGDVPGLNRKSMLMRELFSLKDWSRSDFKSFCVNLLCAMSITLIYLSN